MNYRTYIRSDQWAARRAKYFKTHRRQCAKCGTEHRIHLHHLTYLRAGNEHDNDLLPLCETCHKLVHQWHREHGFSLVIATRVVALGFAPPPVTKLPAKQRKPTHRVKVRRRRLKAKKPVSEATKDSIRSFNARARRLKA